MNPADFARQLEAEREFVFEHSGVVWRLRRWSHPQYMELIGAIPRDRAENMAAAIAVLVPPAVIGWSGVRFADLKRGAPDLPLPFDRALVELVLDRYRDAMLAMLPELHRRYEQAAAFEDAELKN